MENHNRHGLPHQESNIVSRQSSITNRRSASALLEVDSGLLFFCVIGCRFSQSWALSAGKVKRNFNYCKSGKIFGKKSRGAASRPHGGKVKRTGRMSYPGCACSWCAGRGKPLRPCFLAKRRASSRLPKPAMYNLYGPMSPCR